MNRIRNQKGNAKALFIAIGAIGVILIIVGIVLVVTGRKDTTTQMQQTIQISETATLEHTTEQQTTEVTIEQPTTVVTTTEVKETTEDVTVDIYQQEISHTQNSKELDRNQVLAAIERFCREQNPDLNNMSQDEYYFYWDLTEETEQEYVVTYRSYTGSFTYFHVNRGTGNVTTMEYVPGITDGEVPGAEDFQIWDYIG